MVPTRTPQPWAQASEERVCLGITGLHIPRFSEGPVGLLAATAEWARSDMAFMKKGRVLESDATWTSYRVESDCLRFGGFGEIYAGVEVDSRGRARRQVAIKVSEDPVTWHGESYFGLLLAGNEDVVSHLDAFAIIEGTGRRRRIVYVLILEWMDDGTVLDALDGTGRTLPDSEGQVKKQIVKLLKVLNLLHSSGICHGDITPANVFFRGRSLVLGDLGIAKQSLNGKPVELEGQTPPDYCPLDVVGFTWSLSEDTYQVGLLALSLVAGQEVTSEEVCSEVLRSLDASDHFKGWIRQATLGRSQRFNNAGEALDALTAPPPTPARAPRTLQGEVIVFTGRLSITRAVATKLARKAGARVQSDVNSNTTCLVRGDASPLQIGDDHSKKRYEAERLMRSDQKIAYMSEAQFTRLVNK